MASFLELAKGYADKIEQALDKDQRNKGIILSESRIASSYTYTVLKEVKESVDSLVYVDSEKYLSEDDKNRIYDLIRQNLSLPTNFSIRESVCKASNDELKDLVHIIDDMLKGGSR